MCKSESALIKNSGIVWVGSREHHMSGMMLAVSVSRCAVVDWRGHALYHNDSERPVMHSLV